MNDDKKLHFKSVLSQAFGLFRKESMSFFAISLIFFVPYILAERLYWGNIKVLRQVHLELSRAGFITLELMIEAALLALLLLYWIVYFKAVELKDRGEKKTFSVVLQESLRLWPVYFVVKCMMLFKILAWTLVLILPGIYFGTLYSLAGEAAIYDKKKGMDALKLSRQIVRPSIIQYWDNLLFIGLILFGFTFPIMFLTDIALFHLIKKQIFWAAYMVEFFQIFVLIMVINFLWVFVYFLYNRLKVINVQK